MKSARDTSLAQAPKRIDSEEYDLVIPGGGAGSTIAAWTFAAEGKRGGVLFTGQNSPSMAGALPFETH